MIVEHWKGKKLIETFKNADEFKAHLKENWFGQLVCDNIYRNVRTYGSWSYEINETNELGNYKLVKL